MQQYVPFFYDLVTILIFVVMIASCAHRGFARTIVHFIGYAASLFVAAGLSKPIAQAIYSSLIRPAMVENITAKLSQVGAELLPENLMEVVESLPQVLLEAVGVEKDKLVTLLHQLITGGGGDAAGQIADAIVAPLALMLLKAVFFLLLFSVCMFLVRIISSLFGGINRVPVIGSANRLLGGVIGALQAMLTLYIIAVALTLLVSLTGSITIHLDGQAVVIASRSIFQQAQLFRAFVNFNPLDLLMLKQLGQAAAV